MSLFFVFIVFKSLNTYTLIPCTMLQRVFNGPVKPYTFRSPEWSTSIFSYQHQQIIKSKGYKNYSIDYQRENALILNQILSTILKRNVRRSVWRICMKILGHKAFKKLCREIYQNSTKGTSTNLSETKKKLLKTWRGVNNTASTKGTDGRRLTRIAIMVVENLLAWQFLKVQFSCL